MQKNFFTLSGLCSVIFLTQASSQPINKLPQPVFSGKHERHHTNFRTLDIIPKLDGSFFDACAIQDAFQVIHVILEIQYGKLDHITRQRTGSYTLNDEKVSLKDLIILEAKIRKNTQASHQELAAIQACLRTIKDDFNAQMKALKKHDSASKSNAVADGIRKKLIDHFLADQKITDEILRNPEDQTAFDNASSTEFFRFLNNLKHFLEDLTDSCTVAYKSYKDLIKKAHQSHNS